MARILIAVGAVLLAIGIVVGGVQAYQRYQAGQERQQVDAYTAAVLPPARDAGRLVGQTIVPELKAYEARQIPASRVGRDAPVWLNDFAGTRAAFAKAPHPGRLQSIARQFDAALVQYATAMELYARVADSNSGPGQLVAANAAATSADRAYGAAETALACLRASLGLSPVAEFKIQGTCPAG